MTSATLDKPVQVHAKRPNVLVVDDEYGPRESIAYALKPHYEVQTAERALDALEIVRNEEIAVVVLDIRMPEIGGLEALTRIREIDPHVSVIMMTGYGTLHSAQQAMLDGANQYMRKPPNVRELIDAVGKHAESAKTRRREAHTLRESEAMMVRLKQEMQEASSQIWQGRASVELVHDMANPLTVMIGYSGLLREEAETLEGMGESQAKTLVEYAGIVEQAAEYCHHLAENWRQAARSSVEFSDVNLTALVEELKRVIFYNDKSIVLTDTRAHVVRGSKFELTRVVQNLIRNGKESGASRVEVRFRSGPESLELAVSDNGSGMSTEQIEKALKGGYTTKNTGTGLGLCICRHIVGIHGAEMKVESEVGTGTTVRITFPT